jgi:hypothetical protein
MLLSPVCLMMVAERCLLQGVESVKLGQKQSRLGCRSRPVHGYQAHKQILQLPDPDVHKLPTSPVAGQWHYQGPALSILILSPLLWYRRFMRQN